MKSYPARGKLQYSMPSFEQLIGLPVDQTYQLAEFDFLFDGTHTLKTEISILNHESQIRLDCKSSNICDARYGIKYTPIYEDTIPNHVVKEQTVTFAVNVQYVR
jgi:hypothetical protein